MMYRPNELILRLYHGATGIAQDENDSRRALQEGSMDIRKARREGIRYVAEAGEGGGERTPERLEGIRGRIWVPARDCRGQYDEHRGAGEVLEWGTAQ